MNDKLTHRILVENRDDGINLFGAEIPQAAFHAKLDVDFLENSFQHRIHFVGIGEESTAAFFVCHSWERTAHVEVDFLVTQLFALLCETQNLLRIGAENLWRKGFHIIVSRVDFLALQVLGVVLFMDACEKWRVELVDAAKMSLEDISERRIGDALERP